MITYITSFFLSMILIHIMDRVKLGYGNKRTTLFFLGLIPLWFIMACRGSSVGTDTASYQRLYLTLANGSGWGDLLLLRQAPIYVFYSKLLSYVSTSPQAIIILNSIIIFSVTYKCIKLCSANKFDSWYIYVALNYYLWAFNGMRQAVAMAFVLLCYCYMRRKNVKLAILALAVAVGIHQTAIVGVAIILVMIKPFSFKQTIMVFSAAILLQLLGEKLILLFVRVFPAYSGYAGSVYLSRNNGRTNGIYLGLFMVLYVIWRLIDFNRNKEHEADVLEKNPFLFNSILIIIVYASSTVLFRNINAISRVILYFSQISIFLIPDIFESEFKETNKRIIKAGAYLLMLIPFYVTMHNYIPYEFFWN